MEKLHYIPTFLLLFVISMLYASISTEAVEPQVNQQENIAYVSGGIGQDEQDTIDQQGKGFSLKITTATHNGHYLSGGRILIMDSSDNQLLEASGQGPIFYADLEPGTYRIKVEMPGLSSQPAERITEIGDTQTLEAFTWQE